VELLKVDKRDRFILSSRGGTSLLYTMWLNRAGIDSHANPSSPNPGRFPWLGGCSIPALGNEMWSEWRIFGWQGAMWLGDGRTPREMIAAILSDQSFHLIRWFAARLVGLS